MRQPRIQLARKTSLLTQALLESAPGRCALCANDSTVTWALSRWPERIRHVEPWMDDFWVCFDCSNDGGVVWSFIHWCKGRQLSSRQIRRLHQAMTVIA